MSYPLHYEDARPMYTTIDTEYLGQLQSAKKAVESIKEDHLKLIVNSLNKAKTKHPHFCDELCAYSIKYVDQKERELKRENELDTKAGCVYASSILEEESFEMLHEIAKGDKQKAKEEAADCIAVLVRIMEELEK